MCIIKTNISCLTLLGKRRGLIIYTKKLSCNYFFYRFTDLSELDSDTGKNMVGNSIYFVEQGIVDGEAVAKQEEEEGTKNSGTSDDDSMTEDYTSDASSGHFGVK